MTVKQVLAGLAVAAAVVGCRTAGPGDHSVSVMSSGTPRLVWYDGTLLYSVDSDGSTNFVFDPLVSTNDTPTLFLPGYIGHELVIHGDTNVIYRAFGVTTNDWVRTWP